MSAETARRRRSAVNVQPSLLGTVGSFTLILRSAGSKFKFRRSKTHFRLEEHLELLSLDSSCWSNDLLVGAGSQSRVFQQIRVLEPPHECRTSSSLCLLGCCLLGALAANYIRLRKVLESRTCVENRRLSGLKELAGAGTMKGTFANAC